MIQGGEFDQLPGTREGVQDSFQSDFKNMELKIAGV
jgi:hypothetical protein